MLNARASAVPLARREFDVPVPHHLRAYGTHVRATLTGEGPAVVVLGGISGTRYVCGDADGEGGWWGGLVGATQAVCPHDFSILGIEFAADETGRAALDTADQAEVVAAAMDAAGIASAAIVGASYGGMVALSLAAREPGRVDRLVIISADASPHPMATAHRELQRRTVALGMANGCAREALAIARGQAMLTYRTRQEIGERFAGGLVGTDPLGATEPGAYLRAQGDAFVDRMSPGRFLSLSASIDRHRVDPASVRAPTLLIGARSDALVPPSQMEALTSRLCGEAVLHMRDSRFGHDMFLKDAEAIGVLIAPFVRTKPGEQYS